MTRIKICGFKDKEHALVAATAGADFVGMVFAPSPRQVTLSQAHEIVAAIKQINIQVQTVGVFVDTPASVINQIADTCGLDWVQLSGNETWQNCLQINRPIIKSIRVSKEQYAAKTDTIMEAGAHALGNHQYLYMLDTAVKGKFGGTGTSFDWRQARPLTEKFRIIIAGGLTADNVPSVIATAGPWGVDVSSGVESNGVKDNNKIKAFIEAVRRVDVNRN